MRTRSDARVNRSAVVGLALACALACTWAGVGNAAATSDPLQGNVIPALNAVPGRVAVVAYGAVTNGQLPVVLENATGRPVTALRVVGTATTADGSAVTRASTRTTTPVTVAPGGLALAVLGFRKGAVPPGAKLAFRVVGRPTAHATDSGTLVPGQFQLSPPLHGSVVQRLGMTLTNPSRHTLRGRARIVTVCFDEARKPSTATTIVVPLPKLAANGVRPATVPFTSLCPTYLVGAHTT